MSRLVEVRTPAEQSEGTRSQVLRWLKAVGETVTANEPLIELETDKVTVEIAAPESGVLREIVKGEKEEVAPGELLGRIEVGAATAAADGTSDGARERAAASAGGGASAGESAAEAGDAARKLSPAVRRLLAEHGLDARAIRGTGRGGRITVEDVMRHRAAAGTRAGVAQAMDTGVAAPPPRTPAVRGGEDTAPRARRIPHSPVRKRTAEHMVRSLLHTAPHVTSVFEADMSAVLAHRARHREDFARRGAPLTLTAYFLAATVDAIRAVPEANARWTDEELEVFDEIHVGVATAVEERGLLVPVLRNVESLDLFGIARALDDLVTRAREDRLTPADVRGGTFTISNHGVSGSLIAAPIVIHQPQSAILGIGKLEKRIVVIEENGEDRIVVRPRCYVTLTIDHRVMDGHRANRFLQTFVRRLETWAD